MLTYNEQDLIKVLIEREGYDKFDAKLECRTLKNLNSKLQEVLDVWIKTGKIIKYSVKRVSIETIMEKDGSNFIGALRGMSIFINDPNEAKKFLKHNFMIRGFSLFKKYNKE